VRQTRHADEASLEAAAERLGALAGLERDLDRSLLLAVQARKMALRTPPGDRRRSDRTSSGGPTSVHVGSRLERDAGASVAASR